MIIKIINLFFGNSAKKRFKRLIFFIVLIFLLIFVSLQVSIGFDSKGNFYFNIKPAADVNVEVGK